jgi:hypothetical protein
MVLLADPDDKAAVGRDIATTSIGLQRKSEKEIIKLDLRKNIFRTKEEI